VKRRWILAFAVAVLAGTASAGDPPKVELPLGPYVRAGRPLDVRVVGGAERVRAPGTPWALPQGERGDEFILQLTDATVGVLSLEVQRGGTVERVELPVETLPADATIVGVRDEGKAPEGTRALRLPQLGLPTVDEGWLLLDDVEDGVAPVDAVARLRYLRAISPDARWLVAPALLPAGAEAFDALARDAAAAPALPADAATVLVLLAGAELVILLLLRFRDASPTIRAAWLGLPPLAALVFLCLPGRLPGAVSATAFCVDGAPSRCVLVRVAARRDATCRFVLPAAASGAAMLRYSSSDATVAEAAVGREVSLVLRAGESRLFAYMFRSPPGEGAGAGTSSLVRTHAGSPRLTDGLAAWLEGRGWTVDTSRRPFSSVSLPAADGAVVIPVGGARVLPPSK
jgi:hypothetical protein